MSCGCRKEINNHEAVMCMSVAFAQIYARCDCSSGVDVSELQYRVAASSRDGVVSLHLPLSGGFSLLCCQCILSMHPQFGAVEKLKSAAESSNANNTWLSLFEDIYL